MLEYEMHGIQRLPTLLYKSSKPFDMRNYNIPDYEILTCEPLHDICNHTKNLYDELPRHLPKNEKAKLNDIRVPLCIQKKPKIRLIIGKVY